MTRTFETGANRDSAEDKYDFEGFLSPLVLGRFAAYMHKNRHLADGTLRDSDNWQKGIPIDVYMKSAWRHFFELWVNYREGGQATLEEAACGLMFNVMGLLHEYLKMVEYQPRTAEPKPEPAQASLVPSVFGPFEKNAELGGSGFISDDDDEEAGPVILPRPSTIIRVLADEAARRRAIDPVKQAIVELGT